MTTTTTTTTATVRRASALVPALLGNPGPRAHCPDCGYTFLPTSRRYSCAWKGACAKRVEAQIVSDLSEVAA